MASYGKRSFLLFNTLVLPIVCFVCYIAITHEVSVKHTILAIISTFILPVVAYFEYFIVTVTEQGLTVAWPLKRENTSYLYKDIVAVSINNLSVGGKNKKPTLIIYKKDNTSDEHILPSLFMERKALLKELEKYVLIQ